MYLAKNNIIVEVKGSKNPEYAILNPISGSFDLMGINEYEMLGKIESESFTNSSFKNLLLERGYAYTSKAEEEKAIEKAYVEFQEEIQNTQVQLMLVPTYGCNLACTYCFQHGIETRHSFMTREVVDAFFDYAAKNFGDKALKPFITLFGGEPLANYPAQKKIISYIVERCAKEVYELAAVTNGYDLIDYIDILKKAKIKEIQVTLDGSRAVHDQRRATANGRGTFDRIVQGIDAAVKNKMPINLRSVVDFENMKDLVHLAEFLDSKGWLDLPPELFKTQLGRNYELFDCYAKPQHLMSQVELWGEFASLSREHPILKKFHRPDFKGIRHLVDTGEMYMASFDTCPAAKTEWVFDLYGKIYGCTASCGRNEYMLGTYHPEVRLNNDAINTWQRRDVKSIPKCRDCTYNVICGGGCGVIAANQNNGEILSPDCRPIKELIELGINYYKDGIKDLADEPEEKVETGDTCCVTKKDEVSDCVCVTDKSQTGCLICGKELVYTTGNPSSEKCIICGSFYETTVKCKDGHYICNFCHSNDILGIVEKLLAESSIKNPVELAQKVFDLPGLNMHGPEYHSIVPAILVAAYQNTADFKDVSRIKEAVRRGRDIKGGSCGYHGVCGAAAGSGIALSIIENATPLSRTQRGSANRVSGLALLKMSKYGGPRCCKRDSLLSIESFIENTDYFKDVDIARSACKQYKKNKDCIGAKCPYFPRKNKVKARIKKPKSRKDV